MKEDITMKEFIMTNWAEIVAFFDKLYEVLTQLLAD